MIATGTQQTSPRATQRDEATEGEHLVGDRVQERARAGGAVAPREPAVDAVGDESTNHSDHVSQVAPSRSMRSSVGTAKSSRPIVMKLAGVATASGPNRFFIASIGASRRLAGRDARGRARRGRDRRTRDHRARPAHPAARTRRR